MATQSTQNKATPNGQGSQAKEEWNEEQLEEALKRLKLLHIKCRELRSTIPRVLEPFSATQSSGDVVESFKGVVMAATNEIKDFRALYTSDESKRVLEQARKSREANPKGIKPWRARDHPDWLDTED